MMKKIFILIGLLVLIGLGSWQLKCSAPLEDLIYKFSAVADEKVGLIESMELKSARVVRGDQGVMTVYISEDGPAKITSHGGGAINSGNTTYYFDEDGMFYAESTDIEYDRPQWDEGAKETTNVTKKYYFKDTNELLRVIINGKTINNQCGDAHENERIDILEELKELLQLVETDL